MDIMEDKYLAEIINNDKFIVDVIDCMHDWVRVIDKEDNIIYMNRAMSDAIKAYPIGEKCYTVIGRDTPCEICTCRKAILTGLSCEKEEVIGSRTYSVLSSPLKDDIGEIFAVVEVLRDITQLKNMQKKILTHNKKLQNDLELAKKLQCSLLPKNLPGDKMNFSFIYKPCEALGGDFLDMFKIDKDHVGVYIADVSGHGVPASMLTVFLRSTINKKTHSPKDALIELYSEFNTNKFDQDLYITIFYSIINLKDKTMIYSNAGHNVCPVVYNKDKFEILRSPGIPISDWLEYPTYEDREINLFSGDKIFFYTDGILELKNENDEQFGEERIIELLLNDDSEPSLILNNLVEKAYEFAGIKSFSDTHDDITISLVEII